MITEDYVSFEIAKLLKEKRFDCLCHSYFRKDNPNNLVKETCSANWNDTPFFTSRPTLQMAMKWLREVHKISIEITSTGYLIDNDVEWECDIKAGHRLYFKHITNEKSFESCAEEAIKYCLEENLI